MSLDLLSLAPQALVDLLVRAGIRRFYLVMDGGCVRASHDLVAPLAVFLEGERRDFLGHEGLFFQVSAAHATLQGAFIHRTVRGQAAGGVRYWRYDTVEDYLRDGLRLAVGMTRKNALAGLWWGGGKGVMTQNPSIDPGDALARAAIYRAYGDLMTSLHGCYVTAEDAGTGVADMAEIFSRTRFTTCTPPELGGSGNPSIPTARGVVAGMEAALAFAGGGTLVGKSVAIQGVGNVGAALVGFLREKRVARIVATDVSAAAVDAVRAAHPGVDSRAVTANDASILAEDCDIVAPCATGASLNARTIPTIRARIVCGAANNQLEDPAADDQRLFDQGVIYVPDFLVNRMGIVTCADEGAGYVDPDPMIERHLDRGWERSIYETAIAVLSRSRVTGEPPSRVATAIADELSLQPHPIFGHRGRAIIDGLVRAGWERG